MILSNRLSSIISHLPSDVLAGVQRGLSYSFSPVLIQGAGAALQAQDLLIAPVILLVQAGINVSRWYCGDITANQGRRNMVVNITSVVCAGLGTWGGVAVAGAIGAAVGTVVGPIGTVVGGILGAIIGAILGCAIARPIAEKICPDGPLEEFIIKRNEMLESLKQLGCNESSSDEEIKDAYQRGLRLYHPDRNIDCYTKEMKQKFSTHMVAHHIVTTYRKTIEDAKHSLDFYPEDTNITEKGDEVIRDQLRRQWKNINEQLGKSKRKKLEESLDTKEISNKESLDTEKMRNKESDTEKMRSKESDTEKMRSKESSDTEEISNEKLSDTEKSSEKSSDTEKSSEESSDTEKRSEKSSDTEKSSEKSSDTEKSSEKSSNRMNRFWDSNDRRKRIRDLEQKEFYYNCLWIHYYNRTPKNLLRKVLNVLDNPFKVVKKIKTKKKSIIAGLLEWKK